jgi:hypothetical protein
MVAAFHDMAAAGFAMWCRFDIADPLHLLSEYDDNGKLTRCNLDKRLPDADGFRWAGQNQDLFQCRRRLAGPAEGAKLANDDLTLC